MVSKQDQVAEVVEGLGLGLVALGVTRVSSWKLDIEFSFSHAWRRWAHADDYPSIGRAPKPDNEFWIGVTKSERRRWASVVWRGAGADYVIDLNHDSPEEAAQSLGDRPLDQWVDLATPYRERLDEMVARREAEER
jgi:hypothetical protein